MKSLTLQITNIYICKHTSYIYIYISASSSSSGYSIYIYIYISVCVGGIFLFEVKRRMTGGNIRNSQSCILSIALSRKNISN